MKFNHLSDYMAYLLSRGELILSKAFALKLLGISEVALRNSIKRQVSAKHLVPLLRGYYLIIPPEYTQHGIVPSELFIDDLMKVMNVDYYVGLLSSASFYGASHQAIQIFQVMVNKRLKSISLGRSRIAFYYNKALQDVPIQQLKTDRGPINISTPEATAFDLMKYVHQSGNLNHVATVLGELMESLNAHKLRKAAQVYPIVYAQRLGYLLDFLDHDKLTTSLAEYVKDLSPLYTPLRPGRNTNHSEKDLKWRLFINERVESDL